MVELLELQMTRVERLFRSLSGLDADRPGRLSQLGADELADSPPYRTRSNSLFTLGTALPRGRELPEEGEPAKRGL